MPIWEAAGRTIASEAEMSFAQFAHDLLQHPSKEVSNEVLITAYRDAAIKGGFREGTKGLRLDRDAIMENLVEHYGEELLGAIDPVLRTGRVSGWFHVISPSRVFETPVQRHLLLSHHLFSSAKNFWCQVAAAELSVQERGPRKRQGKKCHVTEGTVPSVTKADAQISAAEQSILDYVRLYPDVTIDGLWKNQRRCMGKFLNATPERFHVFRKQLAEDDKTASTVARSIDESGDAVLAERIQQASDRLYLEGGSPVKVTRNRLLNSIGKKGVLSADKYPLARNTLDANAETVWHFWARKFLWTKARLPRDASASSVIVATGSDWKYGLVLNEYFLAVMVPHADSPEALNKTLSSLGIGRRWEGPCPDRVMPVAGRNYVRSTARLTNGDVIKM
jgi:hypothetical protein